MKKVSVEAKLYRQAVFRMILFSWNLFFFGKRSAWGRLLWVYLAEATPL